MTKEKTNKKTTEKNTYDWDKHQDSLRINILNGKTNNILKESFLQEMYIRDVATISKDSVIVNIPFNLHGLDCGAPDCYSTDVSFCFKLGNKLIFPNNIKFIEHNHGCKGEESVISGNFQLIEKTTRYVIYYSSKHERTLVLFSTFKENGTTAFYFTGLRQNIISENNVYTILKDVNDDDENSIHPFRSWVLTTNEYENFVR